MKIKRANRKKKERERLGGKKKWTKIKWRANWKEKEIKRVN
jgi:hypothetical protein